MSVTPAPTGPTQQCSVNNWIGQFQRNVCWNASTPAQGSVTDYRAVLFVAGTSTKVRQCEASAVERSCVMHTVGLLRTTDYDLKIRARIQGLRRTFWSVFGPTRTFTTS